MSRRLMRRGYHVLVGGRSLQAAAAFCGDDDRCSPIQINRNGHVLPVLSSARPDIVIVAPCGFDLDRATADATRVLEQPEWQWTADAQVWAIDANAYLSRPGPRVVDGIDVLARIFNPELFGGPSPDTARRLR